MRTYRRHSIEFKRQIAQEYLAGATMHALSKRHDIDRNLIRIWVERYESGAFDDDAEAASSVHEYEAKIAALERKVGQLAMEIDFLKEARKQTRSPSVETASIITGPTGSASKGRANS